MSINHVWFGSGIAHGCFQKWCIDTLGFPWVSFGGCSWVFASFPGFPFFAGPGVSKLSRRQLRGPRAKPLSSRLRFGLRTPLAPNTVGLGFSLDTAYRMEDILHQLGWMHFEWPKPMKWQADFAPFAAWVGFGHEPALRGFLRPMRKANEACAGQSCHNWSREPRSSRAKPSVGLRNRQPCLEGKIKRKNANSWGPNPDKLTTNWRKGVWKYSPEVPARRPDAVCGTRPK